MRRIHTSAAALLMAVTVLIAAACSGNDFDTASDDSSGDDVASTIAPVEAAESGFEGAAVALDAAAGGESDSAGDEMAESDTSASAAIAGGPSEPLPESVVNAVDPATLGRDIISTADVTMAADNVGDATRRTISLVASLGGFVFGESTVTDPEPLSQLELKVPPASFRDALDGLAEIGNVTHQSISTDDATDTMVDLESRITTAAISVIQLREMLDDARDIDVILRLESQLLERERELETLRGQQRTLEDRVSLATIFVTIEQSGVVRDRSAFVVTAWLNETQSAQCSGTSELAIDPNGSAGLCVEIENVGDIELTDLELRADALNLRTDDFAIEGDLGALAPGDIITATAELNATDGFVGRTELAETIEVRVQVSGVAVDDPTVAMASSSEVALSSAQEEPLPGFLDGLEGALAVLATIGSALLLLAGIALPFVPVIALVVWFLRRSRHKRNAEGTSSQDSAPADDIEREAQHDTTGA